MILQRSSPGSEERRLLLTSQYQPDKVWKMQVLTKALVDHLRSTLGISIGVELYPQLSIAVTERHVKQISKPFNWFDDKTTSADIEVVFAWQSGHRPLQRGMIYGLDSASPDSQQPALLRVYRWASSEWHKFLRMDNAKPRHQHPRLSLDIYKDGAQDLESVSISILRKNRVL